MTRFLEEEDVLKLHKRALSSCSQVKTPSSPPVFAEGATPEQQVMRRFRNVLRHLAQA